VVIGPVPKIPARVHLVLRLKRPQAILISGKPSVRIDRTRHTELAIFASAARIVRLRRSHYRLSRQGRCRSQQPRQRHQPTSQGGKIFAAHIWLLFGFVPVRAGFPSKLPRIRGKSQRVVPNPLLQPTQGRIHRSWTSRNYDTSHWTAYNEIYNKILAS